MAEYAEAHDLMHEPAFNWWALYVLKKRVNIIAMVKRCSARYLKRMHKWGLELPKMVEEVLAIDKKNGNTYWADAIAKEMKNVCIAFKIFPDAFFSDVSFSDFAAAIALLMGPTAAIARPALESPPIKDLLCILFFCFSFFFTSP